ncbi:lipid II flippase Amj family protein [Acuticoccus yangtzensis]|uniref:lipid II flippase Amj family protein n=1 Tax=Acuticoccus yangtzensis TaxID=1443441 RepID=UPI000949AA7F|nr:lipid II flippase Amj family protein [Acuticoccus yangtzensis]
MDLQLAFILALTFLIHLIGTLAYAFRIAGVRTGKIATALSLFNILVLVSRTSNSFQGPFIAKRVEAGLGAQVAAHTTTLALDFAMILGAASLATIVGGLMIPSMQRIAAAAVERFSRDRSVPRLVARAMTAPGLRSMAGAAALPRRASVTGLKLGRDLPIGIILLNVGANALWTVGVLAALYAGAIAPEFRVTAATLSSIINGVATIALFVIVDPYLAGMTDDVVRGKASEAHFRRVVVWMIASRLAGTVLAQALLWPSAVLIVWVARAIPAS